MQELHLFLFTSFDLSCVSFIIGPATRFQDKQSARAVIGAQGYLLVLICNCLIVCMLFSIFLYTTCISLARCLFISLPVFLMGLFVLRVLCIFEAESLLAVCLQNFFFHFVACILIF